MGKLIKNAVLEDSEVVEAKAKILERVKALQSGINGVKAGDPELKEEYEAVLARFGEMRGGNLFYKYLGSGLGNGPFVQLMDGSVKYDFITGIGVHCFGHSHTGVMNAAIDGALEDVVMQGNLQQSYGSMELIERMLRLANKNGAKMAHCFLSTSGVMTGENALKLAFQKHFPAHRVLAYEKCFAGRTIALSQITDKAAYREGVPEVLEVDYVPFYDPRDPEGSLDKTLKVMKSHFKRHPGMHAGMFMELIQGEGGYFTAPAEFHRGVMECCRDHNVAVMADEVQTFTRTSEAFAYQHYGLDDLVDIIWVGKASQACATLFRAEYKPRPGLMSQTFTSGSSAIASGNYILKTLEEEGYFGKEGKNMHFHGVFEEVLKGIASRHPELMEGPWGVGCMVGMTVYKGDAAKSGAFIRRLYDNGVMSFVAGAEPTRVRFLLPVMGIEEKHIHEVGEIIEKTLLEE